MLTMYRNADVDGSSTKRDTDDIKFIEILTSHIEIQAAYCDAHRI